MTVALSTNQDIVAVLKNQHEDSLQTLGEMLGQNIGFHEELPDAKQLKE